MLRLNNFEISYHFNISIVAISFILFAALIAACTTLPSNVESTPSYTIQSSQNTPLARSVTTALSDHPELSGFYLLSSGMDAFVARIGLIDHAQSSLDIQYYIWRTDTTGTILVDRLLRAADRGVRVRLLLDDLDTAGKDRGIMLLDAHPNIEVRLYNPFAYRNNRVLDFVTDLSRVNRRMHNKSLTADNAVTIVGGRNIGNEYFGATSHAEFLDLDVLGIGSISQDVSSMFDQYWNSQAVLPVRAFAGEQAITEATLQQARQLFAKKVAELAGSPYIKALRQSGVLTRMQYDNMQFYWGKAVLLFDDPGKVTAQEVTKETHLAPKLLSYINQSTQQIDIISPYFVPGEKLVEYLGDRVQKGIRVRILTNSLAANDVGVVHAGYMRYRVELLKRGIELYEFKSTRGADEKKHNKKWLGSTKASLHAKTFVLDRRVLFVGSFNLDPRSVALNTEMGVLFETPELAQKVVDSLDNKLMHKAYQLQLIATPADESDSDFEEFALNWITMEDGKEVSYSTEPDTSWWQRFSAGFLSIFVIESFL